MKKIISLVLCLLFVVVQNSTLIEAMNIEQAFPVKGDPLTEELVREIRREFEIKNRRITDQTNPQPCRWSNCTGDKDYYLNDSKTSLTEDKIVPVDSHSADFRRMLVINIPELMGEKLNDNFVKSTIKIDGKAKKVRKKFKNIIDIDEFAKKFTIKLGETLAKDESCRRDLDTISRQLKIPVDDVANAFVSYELSDALISKYSKRALTEFIIAGGLVAVAAAVGVAGWGFGGVIAAKIAISATAISIGTACGVAVLALGGVALAILGLYALDKADDAAIAKFKAQRIANLSALLNRFFDTLAMEPVQVMNSNILVTGLDKRVFKTSGIFWHLRNKNLPNHGYWCEFTQKNLPYSPIGNKYVSPHYHKSLAYFIDILRDMEYAQTKSVDFDELDKYLEGTNIPKEVTLLPVDQRRHMIQTFPIEQLQELIKNHQFTEEEIEEIHLRAIEESRARRQQRQTSTN